MSVARETIVTALEALKKLEEFSILNLADVNRYQFSGLQPKVRAKIRRLLGRLREDSRAHEAKIAHIVSRLER